MRNQQLAEEFTSQISENLEKQKLYSIYKSFRCWSSKHAINR